MSAFSSFVFFLFILSVVLVFMSVKFVPQGWEYTVQRFGKYTATLQPGLNIITPIIGAIGGQPDFSGLTFTLNNSEIRYGAFLNAVIAFLIIAAVIFFAVIKPMNAIMTRMRTEPTPDPLTGKCPFCLSEVQVGATRCPFCTQDITAIDA